MNLIISVDLIRASAAPILFFQGNPKVN